MTAATRGGVELVCGDCCSVGEVSHGRLLALAAAGPEGDTDPVTAAAAREVRLNHADIPVAVVDPGDIDPATPQRRFTLVRLRAQPTADGAARDVVVMRGDFATVMAHSKVTRQAGNLLRRTADRARSRGERPLAVAQAPVLADGTVGTFQLLGFVTVHRPLSPHEEPHADDGGWVRIRLWSGSVRFQHWANVVLIFAMSLTGYYIMDPFVGPAWYNGIETGFLMGWVRLVHFIAGFTWLLIGLMRFVSAFASRDRYLRWPVLWPLKSREDVRNLGRIAQAYAFLRKEGPLYLGHNPLQQLTYTSIYVVCLVQMATGLTLFGLYHQSNPFWSFMAAPVHWWGAPTVRLIHTLIMFVLWAFVIVHVYLAVRADAIERQGGVSAMINGGVWLRRGAKPVDAAAVE